MLRIFFSVILDLMPNINANGIQIEYDTFGDHSHAPLLLIMGLGAQMISWDEGFCDLLAGHGHHVIRFDNRDVGLSTKFDEAGVPNLMEMAASAARGEPIVSVYSLADMARDAAGLLDALNVGAAHIVGASMGGMIAQQFAIDHPHRTLTLTSIMSTTGNPELPSPAPEVLARLMVPAPADRDGNIEYRLNTSRIIGSAPAFIEEDRLRAAAARAYDRAFYPAGTARQMVAITSGGSRKERLAEVRVPTLIIHGEIDPLVPLSGGKDTHASVPGAELMVIPGMGHDLPRLLWAEITGAIAANARKAAVAV
jgi:pimeloyl-ACP methyl ester carboxylesterase